MDSVGSYLGGDVRELLQEALGAEYTLSSELKGGGMSRVFVAREESLGRDVVIKVLNPALASVVSFERFTREIKMAAALQEPHIVPLLSARVTGNGLTYYTMPYVRGESLRARLLAGRINLPEAVGILRNIAQALSYAHSHGIVHRDIKPENVLLSSGTAVVTDFGIAKALAESRTAGDDTSLTGVGTSLGTPAYMAPEQAAGDDVDARADLYAWGVIAYEMLSGKHPFAGRASAQQLMAAHIAEAPPPLAATPVKIPAALSALVMRCLAKNPAERPFDAGEIEHALHAVLLDAPDSAMKLPRWMRVAVLLTAIFGVLVVVMYTLIPPEIRAAALALARRPPPTFIVNRVVVAPLENETGDSALSSLGAMAADLITERVSQLSSVEVVDVRTAAITGEIVRRIPRPFRSGDQSRALAEETGARVLVSGSFFRSGDSLLFRTKVLDASTGTVLHMLPLLASPAVLPSRILPVLADRVAAVLRGASDPEITAAFGSFSTPPSMAAYEATRRAFRAFMLNDTARVALARHALALDSTYGFAIALFPWVASSDGKYALADSALAVAHKRRERLSPVEAAFIDILSAKGVGAQLEASERAVRLAPGSYEARLALVAALDMARQPRRALRILEGLDPNRGLFLVSSAYWYNKGAMHGELGEMREALSAIHAGLGQFGPAHGPLRKLEASLEAARGNADAAEKALDRITGPERSYRPLAAATAAALLRSRAGKDSVGKAFANEWLRRAQADRDTGLTAAYGRLGLLASSDNWARLLAYADSLPPGPWNLDGHQHFPAESARGVALAHLGRRAEALGVDSALAARGSPFWAQGATELARAAIAANIGDTDRAMTLLYEAVELGAIDLLQGIRTLDGDPFLIPLRADPRFQSLSKPGK